MSGNQLNSPPASSFTAQSRYIQATREGPARYPDHILVNHPKFDRNRPSPYTVFFYDITAPNPILLENDVTRDARLRKRNQRSQSGPMVNSKFWKEDAPMDYRHTKTNSTTSTISNPNRSTRHGGNSSGSDSSYFYSGSYTSSSSSYSSYSSSKSRYTMSSTSSKSSSLDDRSVTDYVPYEDRHDVGQVMHPDLRRSKKRDLKFSKREMYFDAHEMPDNSPFPGTIYSHLPQYSTSYKNYPNIAFDVVNPRNYREFYNERHAPGFFTVHRPTTQKVQGRRAEKDAGY
eukprot:GHVH01005656.1.p1 GENE.GHVH01005656.1~~GHVH01005656.1.p1  ORF type:complete len:287 (+),score=28.88 GHVH01005656.1:162-1022(+)